jgi:hypothetical protein
VAGRQTSSPKNDCDSDHRDPNSKIRSLNLHGSLPFASSASTVSGRRVPLGKSLGEAREFALLNSEPGIVIKASQSTDVAFG